MTIGTRAELGSPTEPTTVTVQGMTLKVEDRHIEAAEGEPFATLNFGPPTRTHSTSSEPD
jgi:hypothetical protein